MDWRTYNRGWMHSLDAIQSIYMMDIRKDMIYKGIAISLPGQVDVDSRYVMPAGLYLP